METKKEKAKPSYYKITKMWARFDSWELGSAIDLLLEHVPKVIQRDAEPDQEFERQRNLLLEFAYGSVNITLPTVSLQVDDKESIRVRPLDFLDWAEQKDIAIPEILDASVSREDDYVTLSGAGSSREFVKICRNLGIVFPLPIRAAIRDLSANQIRKHQCRGIAAVIWDEDPNMTKVDMARQDLIIRIGCGGRPPAEQTLIGWLKGLNPNKNRGRRPKLNG